MILNMVIADIDYTHYAELLIDSGINLEKGNNLLIRFHPEGVLLARKCAEIAYARGAGIVEMMLYDPPILKARIEAQTGDESALSRFPGWTGAWERTILDEQWAYLALVSHETPGALADCDQNALMLYERSRAESIREFRDAVSSHAIPWCVAAVPGPRWAEDVLGKGRETGELWNVLKPILMLDRDDPAAAWKIKAAELVERSKKMNLLALDSLRFEDEGTDLRIGLRPIARWVGGADVCRGRITMPNIPTEEVFTTPDRNRCNGHVRVTRPVEIRGTMVREAVLTFENGVLTDFDAQEGRDALEGYVNTDPGSRHLGEVALVGEDSPIAAGGLIFGSILYDENASCHIALGSGYPSCLEGGEDLNDDDAKLAAGCNVSLVHLDFMIGSPGTTVTGIDREGRETAIIENGRIII